MTYQQESWIGKRLDGFVIESLVGEGAFSWVFKAVREDVRVSKAIKVAKPSELAGQPDPAIALPTEALAFISGGTMTVRPDTCQLLGVQAEKLKNNADPALVSVETVCMDENSCYSRMELIEGQTLRESIGSGPIELSLVADLVKQLDRLSKNPGFQYHGDIKPDNIMVTSAGVKLIDPGHFGPLDCDEGNLEHCMISTPAYYPLLTPDDLFAVGIILWEVVCKRHPLDGSSYSATMDKTNLGEELVKWVRHKELVGQYYLTPILEAGRPSQMQPDLPPIVEEVLLKALRLQIRADNKIDRGAGFESFAALAHALDRLSAAGIGQL